jgi:GMP synthase-like glutamine amidotransferase
MLRTLAVPATMARADRGREAMRALVLQHTELNRATVFIDVLRARQIDAVVVDLDAGDELRDWREFDVFVAMGGPQSVFEEETYPWLVAEKRLIREAVAAGRPYFGVCLGSQLLASALGSRVYRGLEPEVGLHPVVLGEEAPRDPVFAGFPRNISVLEFHQDHFELPPGAVRLAGSSRYPNQAYRVGRLAYAIQCHLEVSIAEVEQWLTLAPGLAGVFERRHGSGALERLLVDYTITVPALQASARQVFRRFLENALASGGIHAAVAPAQRVPRWRGGLVGRDHECDRLETALAAARGGRASALVVTGDDGSGRTALLDYAITRAHGMQVISTTGTPARAQLPFGCLAEIAAPLVAAAQPDVADAAAVVGAACGFSASGQTPVVDRLAVGAALVELVANAAERSPLLVAIDDLSFVDEPSADALGFLARRLRAERVATLAAALPAESYLSGIERLAVKPLDLAAARALLEARTPGLPRGATESILAASGGNPFVLREMAADLLDHRAPPLEPDAGAAEWLVLRRTARLGDNDRAALLLFALDGEGAAPIPDAALQARLAVEHDGIRRLLHPLVGSVIVYAATEEERRLAHAALAGTASDPDLRAWHLAAAATGADEDAAAALDAAARRAARRTAWPIAANASEQAARLSADTIARAERLITAARAAAAAGHALAALDHLDAALEAPLTPADRAAAEHLRARVAARTGGARDAAERLVRAVVPELPPERAAAMLADAVVPMLRAGDAPAAIAIARRARAAATPGSPSELAATVSLTTALVLGGRVGEAREHARLLATAAWDGAAADDLELRGYAGGALRLVGRDAAARPVLEDAIGDARRRGARGALPYALVRLAGIDLEEGRWRVARTRLDEALALARESGRAADAGLALGALAWLAAARGDDARCDTALAEARGIAEQIGSGSTLDYAATAAAVGALARGDGAAAETDLRPVVAAQARLGFPDAATRPHVSPELVEALVLRGRSTEAQRLAADFSAAAERLDVRSARAAAVRCAALTCPDAELEAVLERARALDPPFERARSLLAAASRLARLAPDRAAKPIEEAARAFAMLGALAWLTRTIEIAATAGLTVTAVADDPMDRLEADDLAVVVAAAGGAGISEIARRLARGPRTVEAIIDDARRTIGLDAADDGPVLADVHRGAQ